MQALDAEIGKLLKKLESIGELDNTLIVVSSDNGMPFPRAKSNLYDMGTRVPLVIRWGDKIKQLFRSQQFVNLTDLAPTFLDAAGLDVPPEITGESLLPGLLEGKMIGRKQVCFGKERHAPGQEMGDWGGYPSRAIRTKKFLYIYNFTPDRWPAGTPHYHQATIFPGYYGDVDRGPSKRYMIDAREKDPLHARLFSFAFGKREPEELYDLEKDPDQLQNVAGETHLAQIQQQLKRQLFAELTETNDPRVVGGAEEFEKEPNSGGNPFGSTFPLKSRNYSSLYIESFPSAYVPARGINVLVPKGANQDERFPVLYMFDGQLIFQQLEALGEEFYQDWHVDVVLDS